MKFNSFLVGAALMSMTLMACSDDDTVNNGTTPDEGGNGNVTEETVSGDVEGVWKANSVVKVSGHLVVPEGKSLTIEEGVQVIFDDNGVGVNHVPIEFTVNGNLYCEGTAENPILMSVDEADRTEDNIFAGLWGGIVASESCEEMLIDHTIIEYTGGQVIEGSPAATNGVYTAGDDAYPQITTNNINGKYVITNSVLRNGWSDGIYLMGGSAIIANNIFAANGYDGAEAVNVKAGCTADVAGNIMFSPNTNGLKLSSSGQSETRGQAKIQAYNNTIINAGWRRDGEKGGCVYVEKNALANVVNNLMVNCKFRAMTPNYKKPNDPEEGYDSKSVIDYNFYASGSQKSDIVFTEDSGVAYSWEGYNYDHENYYTGVVDANSVIATENNLEDPMFVNFDVNGVGLTDYAYNDEWDFHVQAGSPVLNGAYTGSDITPYFAGGLTVNGQSYQSPAIQSYFGAYGTK
ncbi:hypothetical protein [uncultured Phocaeicola sp.]|jgi:hypothetical protein|uniref:hypothetical protein n=1 Tax=uncultured Phocaeicola sp. TaxID=990718 RepID=UPI0015AB1590|nr:hypothetical protein [uncultured Phocaeicola sp.]